MPELSTGHPAQVSSNTFGYLIEKLIVGCGGYIEEGRVSRTRMELNGVRSVFHRPHPEKETGKGALKSVRRFLSNAGITL